MTTRRSKAFRANQTSSLAQSKAQFKTVYNTAFRLQRLHLHHQILQQVSYKYFDLLSPVSLTPLHSLIQSVSHTASQSSPMADANTVHLSEPHAPKPASLESFRSCLHEIKNEFHKSRAKWDAHQPEMFARCHGHSDHELLESIDLEKDLVQVRTAESKYIPNIPILASGERTICPSPPPTPSCFLRPSRQGLEGRGLW
jgi:hypothetical protein